MCWWAAKRSEWSYGSGCVAVSGWCFNVYGPTECTVDVTAAASREVSVPVLGSRWNVRVYVLDSAAAARRRGRER